MSARDAASVLAKLRHTKPKDNEQPPAGEPRTRIAAASAREAAAAKRRERPRVNALTRRAAAASNRPPDLIRGTAPPLPTMEVRGETRECRSGSRASFHRAPEVLDEGRQGTLHEPPSRDAGTPCRTRAVTGERLSPPSERSRREAQGPHGQGAGGGTGKAAVRGRTAATIPDAPAPAGGRVRGHQDDGGFGTPRPRRFRLATCNGTCRRRDWRM